MSMNFTRFVVLTFITCYPLLFAGNLDWHPLPPHENAIRGDLIASSESKGHLSTPNPALIEPSAKIFPHLAVGGGWETVIVIVNMSSVPVHYHTYFYDQVGRPMPVTFRTYPAGEITTTSALDSNLPPGTSFNFALFDTGGPTQVGWAELDYDESVGRLGGYAVFRQKVSSSVTAEALVPLSPLDDYKFFMPFDNIEGFNTGIALVNPAANLSSHINLSFLSLDGKVILTDSITLAPGNQTAFSIPDRYPQLRGALGTVYVKTDTNRLSALGLRFNPKQTFTSIPIMNWIGMF